MVKAKTTVGAVIETAEGEAVEATEPKPHRELKTRGGRDIAATT